MNTIDLISIVNTYDNSEDESDDTDSDSDFFEMAVLVAFPRAGKVVRKRPNYFVKYTDEAFLDRFRLTKRSVKFIIELVEKKIATPTTRNNAVTAAHKVLLTLRYYATGSFVRVCGDFAGVHESTAGKIIREVSKAIAELRPHFIYMPETEVEMKQIRQEFYNIAKFPRCIGALDCTHIKIRSPGGEEPEIFRNRKNYFSINVQTISDAKLRMQNIVARWPGSSHDWTILNASVIKRRFDMGQFKDSVLVADSGYSIQKYIITPIQNPSTQVEQIFNESQIVTRNPVERSYGVWKRRFPILSVGCNVNLYTVFAIIVATAVLHNIALKFGDAVPRPTRELEVLIDMLELENIAMQAEGSNRSIHRKPFLNYFSTWV